VKIETTEAGLVGWGCATFTQRALAVQTALEHYLKPFLIGRDVDEIEDLAVELCELHIGATDRCCSM
jgi:mannonate dehydratase